MGVDRVLPQKPEKIRFNSGKFILILRSHFWSHFRDRLRSSFNFSASLGPSIAFDKLDSVSHRVQRVEMSNSMVVSAFRDEAVRTKEALRETVIQADRTKYQAEQIAKEMKPAIAAAEEIGRDLGRLRDDLLRFRISFERMEKMTADTQRGHVINSDLFKRLTKEIRANWATTGLGFGMVLEYALIESQGPPWSGFVFFVLIVGLVQWLLRWDWKRVRTLAKKILPATKTKPPV